MFFDVKKRMDGNSEKEGKALRIRLARLWLELYRKNASAETEEIRALKEKIRELNLSMDDRGDIYWWELPWKHVLEKLRRDERVPDGGTEKNGWEWEYTLVTENVDHMHFFCLEEHGRKYGVNVLQDEWEYGRNSPYDEEEQEALVKEYKKKIRKFEFYTSAMTEGAVYSEWTGRVYDSLPEYYMSAEAWMARKYYTDRYERSLYTESKTHHLSAQSANLHCWRIYEVGGYHVTDGTLDLLQAENFSVIAERGPQAESAFFFPGERDAAVLCAASLAKTAEVKRVPFSLLEKKLTQGAATYESAMRQAELFVCLAEKIIE